MKYGALSQNVRERLIAADAADYRSLGRPEGTGAVGTNDEAAGRAAYEAHVRDLGEHEPQRWEALVWPLQHAWMEAARAARAVK